MGDVELPANYKPTSLKAGPMVNPLDLGIHNVQGINVWANTAPRGWGSIQRKRDLTTFCRLCQWVGQRENQREA
jgi:glucan biosynthesis protein